LPIHCRGIPGDLPRTARPWPPGRQRQGHGGDVRSDRAADLRSRPMSRITEIRYVGYGVEDFETERRFYTENWGLVEVASDTDTSWLKTHGSDEHHVVRLHRAPAGHVEVIALAADSRADVDALHETVVKAGCRIVHAPLDLAAPGGGYGFRFFSPDGLPFEISAVVERLDKRDLERWEGMPVRISHIVLHSPDHQAAVRFFTDVLGLRVSDWPGDFICF